jgi:3-methylcrotonyl-CoA carboxylase alpha subunit
MPLITGNVWKIVAQVGDVIEEEAPIMILESMKMEIPVTAPETGTWSRSAWPRAAPAARARWSRACRSERRRRDDPQAAGRQPRRDRLPRDPQRAGARLETVAVYSEADAQARHVAEADAVRRHRPGRSDRELPACRPRARAAARPAPTRSIPATASWPRTRLSPRAVEAAGLTWVGPTPESIDDMGDKERARLLAKAAGVPVLPGSARFSPRRRSPDSLEAGAVGFPLLVKAAAGGGGIGMRRVDDPGPGRRCRGDPGHGRSGHSATARSISTLRAARAACRGAGVRLRRRPRRPPVRARLLDPAALPEGDRGKPRARPARGATRPRWRGRGRARRQERYRGAGTVEFVVDADSFEFFFLEMNTRIQVEHPVTEMNTGLDLVGMQLQLAGGGTLPFARRPTSRPGHAIECRLYAERPRRASCPRPARSRLRLPMRTRRCASMRRARGRRSATSTTR